VPRSPSRLPAGRAQDADQEVVQQSVFVPPHERRLRDTNMERVPSSPIRLGRTLPRTVVQRNKDHGFCSHLLFCPTCRNHCLNSRRDSAALTADLDMTRADIPVGPCKPVARDRSGNSASFANRLDEHPPFLVASDYALSPVTSRHDLVHRALKLDSASSRHPFKSSSTAKFVKNG
jgi:hypothetical protein